jgi:hypothetical protein
MVSPCTQSAHEARTSDKETIVLTRPSDSIDALYNSDLHDIIEGYGASLRTGLPTKETVLLKPTTSYLTRYQHIHPLTHHHRDNLPVLQSYPKSRQTADHHNLPSNPG